MWENSTAVLGTCPGMSGEIITQPYHSLLLWGISPPLVICVGFKTLIYVFCNSDRNACWENGKHSCWIVLCRKKWKTAHCCQIDLDITRTKNRPGCVNLLLHYWTFYLKDLRFFLFKKKKSHRVEVTFLQRCFCK